jgi:fructose-1,6-bisphosphatase/inositol monophosphatase family enzyme
MKNSQLLKIAISAAQKAGQFLSQDGAVSRRATQEFKHDVKLEADLQSEKIILEFLKKESGLPILSEESGASKGAAGDLQWIVDPIDGTFNFLRQIPGCCVSIGLWEKDKPLLGVIYDFERKELFSGIVGEGAWLNEKPFKVSQVKAADKAVLFTGFAPASDFSDETLKPLISQLQSYRKLRWIGSAALSLAYVACGRGDVYYERDIQIWDVAAGIPLVLAAGGVCRWEKGKSGYTVFASNGQIHDNSVNDRL